MNEKNSDELETGKNIDELSLKTEGLSQYVQDLLESINTFKSEYNNLLDNNLNLQHKHKEYLNKIKYYREKISKMLVLVEKLKTKINKLESNNKKLESDLKEVLNTSEEANQQKEAKITALLTEIIELKEKLNKKESDWREELSSFKEEAIFDFDPDKEKKENLLSMSIEKLEELYQIISEFESVETEISDVDKKHKRDILKNKIETNIYYINNIYDFMYKFMTKKTDEDLSVNNKKLNKKLNNIQKFVNDLVTQFKNNINFDNTIILKAFIENIQTELSILLNKKNMPVGDSTQEFDTMAKLLGDNIIDKNIHTELDKLTTKSVRSADDLYDTEEILKGPTAKDLDEEDHNVTKDPEPSLTQMLEKLDYSNMTIKKFFYTFYDNEEKRKKILEKIYKKNPTLKNNLDKKINSQINIIILNKDKGNLITAMSHSSKKGIQELITQLNKSKTIKQGFIFLVKVDKTYSIVQD